MADDLIHFFCPYCGIKLTVPSSKAGVAGPCPSCANSIQAPSLPPAPLPRFEPRTSPPADPGSPLKPEPRQLPARAPVEISARPIQEQPALSGPEPEPTVRYRMGERRDLLQLCQRLAMLLLFFTASVALVFGILKFLKRQHLDMPIHDLGLGAVKPETGNAIPRDGALTDEPGGDGDEAASVLADGLEPVSPWAEAEAVLEEFLAATTLEERLPLMETRMEQEELAVTCLAGPLPNILRLVPELRKTNPTENMVDFFYTVELDHDDPATRLLTMLVRARGDQRPKVVAEPFLDTFGGRLAAYASTPTDKGGIFRVVVYAVASCTDPAVPNREKKLTLKLLASDTHREIARAYFGRQSSISEMLENNAYELSYGIAKACTVLLRWNDEDDPQRPFLEALAIRDLSWNP